MTNTPNDGKAGRGGSVAGMPLVILRAEGLAVLAAATAAYAMSGASWWLYLILFLAPDLSFLAYWAGSRVGAFAYNAVHTYVVPILVGLAGYFGEVPFLIAVALIWAAHIGMDRLLGYGLKYPSAFGDTHLGRHRQGAAGTL